MESYKPPKSEAGLNKMRIRRIFRDESGLPTSGDLGADIKKALEQSEYLIVICSREVVKSQWCMQEIEYFKQLHQGHCNHIAAMMIYTKDIKED